MLKVLQKKGSANEMLVLFKHLFAYVAQKGEHWIYTIDVFCSKMM
jgi:hypothetical protein